MKSQEETQNEDEMSQYEIIDLLADDKNIIIYRPILRQICESVTASILFSQLIYWFNKYPDGYFKNIQQDNPDSWCNELGFSYTEFKNAFDKIGIRYISKTKFKKAKNPFIKDNKEYMFCCYNDRMSYQVYFFWNYELIRKNLSNLRKLNYSNSTNSHYSNSTKLNTVIQQSDITCNSTKLNQIKGNNRLIKETNKRLINNGKFIKPTIEEISVYCIERNNNIDPEQFFDFYEAKGWYIGKNKMKDWKAAVRTWERNEKNKNNDNYPKEKVNYLN
ncbi:MAG: hypothetical protein ACFFDN_09185 [Candidatus Hodarchaeota archaeon]